MQILWQNKYKGFTLVEMMAVLVLLTLLTAVVLPNFERWFSNTEDQAKATDLVVRLQKLYARSVLMGLNLEFNNETFAENLPDGKPAFDMPKGWKLAENQNLKIRSSGTCPKGLLIFESSNKKTVSLEINPENCEILIRQNQITSQ